MPRRRRLAHLLTVLLTSTAAVVAFSNPARAIAAPSRVEVHYQGAYANVRWTSVSDATSYSVQVSKDGYYGPWRLWTTNSSTTSINIPLSNHPYRDQQGAYRYRVTASNSSGGASRSVALNRSQGSGVSAADSQKAANKATSCLKQGLEAGAAGAATSGVYAVAAAWIPGLNLVSAGTVAATVGSAASSTYIVCLLPW